MDCTGYALPSLTHKETDMVVGRALRLDKAKFTFYDRPISRITFEQPASFKDAEFNGGASFRECTFKGADFSHAVFRGGASFRECTFKGADFSHAVFRGGASFRECTFKGADFSHAVFRGGTADFASARFFKQAYFSSTMFAKAVFKWAMFAGCVFTKATFHKDASFYGATFGSTARFCSAKFLGGSEFTESEFKKGADFSGACFEDHAHFRRVKTRHPKMIRFDGNLSNVSFLNTNLKEVGFGSMTTWLPQALRGGDQGSSRPARPSWNRRPGGARGTYAIWDKKWRTYDERELDAERSDFALNLDNVLGVYRDLRDNFDQHLRYDVSGGFFVREMEIGRKYKSDENARVVTKPIFRRALTWHAAYNVLAEYGQSPKRPLAFLALIFATGSLLLWCPTEALHGLEIPCEDGLEDSILRSFVSMIPLPLSGHFASPVDIGLKAAALPAVATFLISLRRRFEKTRRH